MNSLSEMTYANNGWYLFRDSDTVVIFIHGFVSDSAKCWKAKNGTYWPEIIAKDKIFGGVSIYLGGYHTSIDSGEYDIAQCAAELRDSLELSKQGRIAPLAFSNIIFVCHSLGGIICRRLLEESSAKFVGKTVGILLVASPSMGSAYADKFHRLSKLYGNKIGKQLRTNGEILKDIDNRFRNLIENNQFNKLIGAEACEQYGPIRWKYFPMRMPPIVNAQSASRYFGQTRLIPGTDHSTIAKPDSENHKTHGLLQHFYKTNFELHKIKVKLPKSMAIDTMVNPDPLFEVYCGAHQKYYIERKLDSDLLRHLGERSVWIFGTSGVGKTSIAKRAIEKLSNRTTEIHLGHIDEEKVKEQLLVEIICALNPEETTDGNNLHQRAIQLIKERSNETTIPIYLDEVPISSSAATSIIAQTIGNVLDAVKLTQTSNVNFLISSIFCPPPAAISQKMHERIMFCDAKHWTSDEIERLFNLLAHELKLDEQVSSIKDEVIVASVGLPRFVKSFFRRVASQNIEALDLSLALNQAKQESGV